MKILYVNKSKFDYMQDFIYSGLVKVIGAENIIESPWNLNFHWNYRVYPKNIGECKGTLFKSVLSKLSQKPFDVVIVSSCYPDTIRHYFEILPSIPSDVVTVFIDGGDRPEVGGDFDRLGGMDVYENVLSQRPFDLIFKREYLLDKKYDENVYPLTMCFDFRNIPPLKGTFKYDVAFWAVESHEIRTKVLDLIQNKFDCENNGTIKSQVMKKYKRKGMFYLQELSACKIGLNFRGAGWDTLRYWEIPALGGFMISQRPQIKIDNDYVDGEDIVYCKDDLSNLVELCDYYLSHDSEREKIAAKAKERTMKYHTNINRADYILEKINELATFI
ncbi:glycosyltransferase family 1 protein [Sulfurimonas sp. MAG313]|nr:glycosyltransferase [Sulfurimonas sp. MAG313]MDF1881090.1 glycosyltransferase family 1 protein [Sulfurimonas sp. MAG313]